jgi:hypothetical protein
MTVSAAAPELAAQVQQRFDAHGLALLGTLTAVGSPRLSAVEPLFALGRLWLGMMPASRKADDLLRDPRLALHNATVDKQVADGDAKLAGRARVVADPALIESYRDAFVAAAGDAPPAEEIQLFEVDVESMSFLIPAGDHLLISSWQVGQSVRTVKRY